MAYWYTNTHTNTQTHKHAHKHTNAHKHPNAHKRTQIIHKRTSPVHTYAGISLRKYQEICVSASRQNFYRYSFIAIFVISIFLVFYRLCGVKEILLWDTHNSSSSRLLLSFNAIKCVYYSHTAYEPAGIRGCGRHTVVFGYDGQ